jgi:hypothetical protein
MTEALTRRSSGKLKTGTIYSKLEPKKYAIETLSLNFP